MDGSSSPRNVVAWLETSIDPAIRRFEESMQRSPGIAEGIRRQVAEQVEKLVALRRDFERTYLAARTAETPDAQSYRCARDLLLQVEQGEGELNGIMLAGLEAMNLNTENPENVINSNPIPEDIGNTARDYEGRLARITTKCLQDHYYLQLLWFANVSSLRGMLSASCTLKWMQGP